MSIENKQRGGKWFPPLLLAILDFSEEIFVNLIDCNRFNADAIFNDLIYKLIAVNQINLLLSRDFRFLFRSI